MSHFTRAFDQYRTTGAEDATAMLHRDIGEVQLEAGQLDDAIGHFRNALSISQERHDTASVAVALRLLGKAFHERGDFGRAEESYREADRALDEGDDEAEKASLLLYWGSLLEDLAHHTKARDRYKSALGIAQGTGDVGAEIAARRHLASALQELGAVSEAEQELVHCLSLLKGQEDIDQPELIEVKNVLGGVIEDQGRIEEALVLFREAYRLADTLEINPAKVECLRRMGSAMAVRGEFAEAASRYQQAIEICRQLDDRKALSEIYGDIGDVYIEQGNLKDAIRFLKEAERLDHDDPLGFALAKRRLGTAYQEKGDYKRAEEYYSEADSLLGNLDDDGERAVLYVAWGSLSEEKGAIRDALNRYHEALAINSSQRNALGEAICRRHIGSALHGLGRLDDAAEELRHARAICERQGGEDRPELIEISNCMGAVLEDGGHIADALEHFREAYTHADNLEIEPAKVESLRCMGSALAASGNLMEAEARYREAVELCETLGDEVALSALLGEVGDVYADQGRMRDAIQSYKGALALDQEHSDRPGLALANRRLASAYQLTGNLERARELYSEAERLLLRLEDDDERALLFLRKGSLLEDEGKWSDALSEYGRARSKYEGQRNAIGVAAARRAEGAACLQLGRISDAETSAEAALETVELAEEKPELVECLNLLGAVRRSQGDLYKSRELHSRALSIAESIDLRPARAASLRQLGAALAEDDNDGPRLALERLDAALEIYEQLKDEVACAELHDDIADVNLDCNEIEEAVRHYERGLGISRRLGRSALTADILLGLARCSRRSGNFEKVRLHVQEARTIIGEIDNSRPRQARLLLELAQIDADDGKAIEGLEKALGAFQDCNDTAGEKECHRLLLAAFTRSQDFSKASMHLSRGLELEGNVQALWAVMLNQLHPAIGEVARGSFAEGRFTSGVLEALKVCEGELRARCDIDHPAHMPDITNLVLKKERRGGIAPWSDERQLKAFGELCGNAFSACRNPLAHGQLSMDASQAFAWLGVAHLMLTLMDLPESDRVEAAK